MLYMCVATVIRRTLPLKIVKFTYACIWKKRAYTTKTPLKHTRTVAKFLRVKGAASSIIHLPIIMDTLQQTPFRRCLFNYILFHTRSPLQWVV